MQNCSIRLLTKSDYHKGFLNLLNQLTPTTQNCSFEKFSEMYDTMMKLNPTTKVFVIEKNDVILATAKLFLEFKLHNGFTFMGHVEDVVVNENFRGKGYGKIIMEHVRDTALNNQKCYKVVLNCSESNVAFYKKCGFTRKGKEMVIYQK